LKETLMTVGKSLFVILVSHGLVLPARAEQHVGVIGGVNFADVAVTDGQ
jgi:hypothetical protein